MNEGAPHNTNNADNTLKHLLEKVREGGKEKKTYLAPVLSRRIEAWQKLGKDLVFIRNLLQPEFRECIEVTVDSKNLQHATFNMDRLLDAIERSHINFYFPAPGMEEEKQDFVTLPPDEGMKIESKDLHNPIERRKELKVFRIEELLSSNNTQYIYLRGKAPEKKQWRTLPYDGFLVKEQKIFIIVSDQYANITFVIHGVTTKEEASLLLEKKKSELKSPDFNYPVYLVKYTEEEGKYESNIRKAMSGEKLSKEKSGAKNPLSLEKRASQYGLCIVEGEPGLYIDQQDDTDKLWASSSYLKKMWNSNHEHHVEHLLRRFDTTEQAAISKAGPSITGSTPITLYDLDFFNAEYKKIIQLPEINQDGKVKFKDEQDEYAIDLYFVNLFQGAPEDKLRASLAKYRTRTARKAGELREYKVSKISNTIKGLQDEGFKIEKVDLPILNDNSECIIDTVPYISLAKLGELTGKDRFKSKDRVELNAKKKGVDLKFATAVRVYEASQKDGSTKVNKIPITVVEKYNALNVLNGNNLKV